MTDAVHPSPLTLERLALGELSSRDAVAAREHLKGCTACRGRLESMDAQAASFSRSPHSSPARARLVRADRAWKRKAMFVALASTLAAASVAVVPLVASSPPPVVAVVAPPRPAVQAREALEVRLSSAAAPLRRLSLRGREVAFGEGALEAAGESGQARPFLLRHTEVDARIIGFASTVTVTQEFENPFRSPVDAIYVFPLPDDAAVDEMTLRAGARVIRATIQKRETARRMYEEAKSQGRRAALLDQERPNIFTQSVANLLPGERVQVTLRYVAPLEYDDGDYTFHFPMVVGPRSVPGQALPGESQGTGTSPDTTRVLDASRVTPPLQRSGRDIAVRVHLDAGSPVEQLWSVSHRMLAERRSAAEVEVALDPSDAVPNKDFVLRWRVSGASKRAALLASGGAGGPFALMVLPEAPEAHPEVVPKEMVFVIDTSCSMSGPPLDAAKRAMRSAIEQMNPDDTFMLIDFASTASAFHATPLPSTPSNVARALSYLQHLPAGGGTNQLEGLVAALHRPEDPKRLRMVLLMTDGYIGNEREIFAAAKRELGHARLFGFGVGSSVNHFLLGRLSEIGRGFYQSVRPDEDPQDAVARFVRRIERPLLTDVSIDWGGLQVADVLPAPIPDLFDAQPLVLFGRARAPGKGVVTVRGSVAGRTVETRLEVVLPEEAGRAPGLAALWARARIEALERHQDELESSQVIREITSLGLEYHLVTSYTSLVAVEDVPVTKTAGQTVTVPSDAPDLTAEAERSTGKEKDAEKAPGPTHAVDGAPTPGAVDPNDFLLHDPSKAGQFTYGSGGIKGGLANPSGTAGEAANKSGYRPLVPGRFEVDGRFKDGSSAGGSGSGSGGGGLSVADRKPESSGASFERAFGVQETPPRPASTPSGGGLRFHDETVEGELARPAGEYLEARKKVEHATRLTVPEHLPARSGGDEFKHALGPEKPATPPAAGGKESLGQSDVMAVVLAHKPALAACVAEQQRREPGLSGKLVFRWRITTAGRVVQVELLSSEFASTYVAACLKEEIARWRFPLHRTQGEPVTFPFKF